MNEMQLNQATADRICEGNSWHGRQFRQGDCVALLDGEVVAVADDLDVALKSLRATEANPRRGMVFEVAPPVIDFIRRV